MPEDQVQSPISSAIEVISKINISIRSGIACDCTELGDNLSSLRDLIEEVIAVPCESLLCVDRSRLHDSLVDVCGLVREFGNVYATGDFDIDVVVAIEEMIGDVYPSGDSRVPVKGQIV
ncbi:MAG: hypothetical protein WC797_01045 [Candidatus Paceibacterota bacterium]|jgi:hypothetical protein